MPEPMTTAVSQWTLRGRVDRAGRRLDHDRALVGEIVGYRRTAGRRCATIAIDQPPPVSLQNPDLQAGLEMTERDALAQVDVAGGARRAHRVDAADGAMQARG